MSELSLYFPRRYSVLDWEGGRHFFSTQIRATPETIGEIVKVRNLGEVSEERDPVPTRRRPDGKSLADLIETEGFTPATLHMACFVGFLALKSGVASVEDVLGDCGLIHEIAHQMDLGSGDEAGNPWATTEGIKAMTRRIERAIPGHPYR